MCVVEHADRHKGLGVACAEMLEQLELGNAFQNGASVTIKPNFTYPWYKPGVTTSPNVLSALVSALRDWRAKVTIVESDGGSHAWRAEEAFAGHGVPEMCQRYSAKAINLSREERVAVATTVAGREISVELPRCLLEETSFFITVPVPKLHAMTRVSLGFKNQWGCIPDVKRLRHHPEFAHMVIAVNRLVRTRLAFFDGTYFLDRNGPMEGDPVHCNLLIAGDVGLASRVVCELMGVDPMLVAHKRLAISEGLMPSEVHPEQLNVPIEPLCRKFHLKRSFLDWIALGVFHSRLATRLFYDSEFAGPLHELLYWFRGRPKDFQPNW